MIRVNNFAKYYGDFEAVKNVSFFANKGEITALIGLNGAGKSTVIKAITNNIKNFKGEIYINNYPPSDLNAKKYISYLPEVFSPPIYLTGYEYINYITSLHGIKISKESINKYAELIDFPTDRLNFKIKTYSKGMKQKISLIATILSNADFLILDEPMSGLDPLARVDLKKLLLNLKNEGKGILFSSHILNDIEELADKIVVIHKGLSIYEGSARELVDKYSESNLEMAFIRLVSDGGIVWNMPIF